MEIFQCSQVGFPRLHVWWIHGDLLCVIGVFVAKTSETVTEFMNDDGLEQPVVGHGKVVGVENASSAILIGVHQYDDVLVWGAGQQVMQIFEMKRGQITLAVESVEMGVQGRVLPDAFSRNAGAAVFRGREKCGDMKTVAQRLKRFMGEKCLHGLLGILDIGVHLLFLISFSHVSDVYAPLRVLCFLKGDVRRRVLVSGFSDQYVSGYDGMGECRHHFLSVVIQFHGHVDSIFGHRGEKHVLERFAHSVSLVVREPLLKEGGERVSVNHCMAGVVAEDELSVAFYG